MYDRLLIISLYSMVLNTFFRPLNSTIASIFGYFTIICTILYPILYSKENGKVRMGKAMFSLLFILLLSIVFSINYFSTVGFTNNLIAIVSFVTLYWSLTLYRENCTEIPLRKICRINYALCAVLLLYGYGPFSFKYTVVTVWGAQVFSMGLGNPNAVAVYVLFAIIILLAHMVSIKTLTVRVIDAIIVGLLLYLLVLLSSRTVVACALLLLIGYIISKKTQKIMYFWSFIIIWPIIMIFITLAVGEKNLTLLVLGKAIETGRYEMYRDTINNIIANPVAYIFGSVFRYNFLNMHNAPLTIISNVGFVGLVIYIGIWYQKIKRYAEEANNALSVIAVYALLAFVIQSSSESLLMIGTIPYATMVIVVDKMAKGEITNSGSR